LPNYEILDKKRLARNVVWFKIRAPLIASKAQPGQFIILRLHEKGERFPLSLFNWDPGGGTIEVIVREVGKSTIELGKYGIGDRILNIAGPLGNPMHIGRYGKVVLTCSGGGLADCYPVARAMKRHGNSVTSIIGFDSRDLVILEDEFKSVSDEVIVTTSDGSYGVRGLVTDILETLLTHTKGVGMVFTAGPVLMSKKVAEITLRHGIPTYVSLHPIMVDGTGMCGACRVRVGGRIVFACVDGPHFNAHEVDFDELAKRLSQYKDEERIALEKYLKAMRGR